MNDLPKLSPSLDELGRAVMELLRARAGALALTEAMIASVRPRTPPAPRGLPMLGRLAGMADLAAPETARVVAAVTAAAHEVAWQQTYSAEDGFDPSYLERYGWFDLAGPGGAFRADGIRVMIGYWGAGLVYPDHSHPPDEHYLVLAGSAQFRLGDEPWRRLGPGEVFHTPPHAVHSAEMTEEGLLAISVWRAEDLAVRIDLDGREVLHDT